MINERKTEELLLKPNPKIEGENIFNVK